MDSGAQSSLATIETGELLGPPRSASPIMCVFGAGGMVPTCKAIDIGTQEFHVVPNLTDNLFSPIQLLGEGYVLHLDSTGGVLENSEKKKSLPIQKADRGYKIWLNDLKLMNYSSDVPLSKLHYADSIYKLGLMETFRHNDLKTKEIEKKLDLERAFMRSVLDSSVPLFSTSEGAPRSISEGDLKQLCDDVQLKRSTKCAEWTDIERCHFPAMKSRRLTGESVMETFKNLHEAMGHPSLKQFIHAISGDKPTWRNCPLTDGQVRRCYKNLHCPMCVLSKRRRVVPVNDDTAYVDEDKQWKSSASCKPGNIISLDPSGPINPLTSEGFSWMWLAKDVATGYNWTFTTKSKDAASAVAVLSNIVEWLEAERHQCYIIRTDSELVLNCSAMKDYCVSKKLLLQQSIPYVKQQSLVERDMQTIVQGVGLLMASQPWLRKDKWDMALYHYTALRNRTWNSNCEKFGDRTPHHIMTGVPTDLSREFKFAFGDMVAVNVPDELEQWKFDTRNQLGIYVGESSDTKGGHLIYWPYTQSITNRLDCTKLTITDAQFLHYFSKLINARTKSLPYGVIDRAVADFRETGDTVLPITAEELCESDWKDIRSALVCQLYDENVSVESIIAGSRVDTPFSSDASVRKSRKRRLSTAKTGKVRFDTSANKKRARSRSCSPPAVPPVPRYAPVEAMGAIFEDDDIIDLFMAAHAESPHLLCHRLTVAKALQSDQREAWITAIRDEIELLFTRGTLEAVKAHLVPTSNRKIIHSTMQLKIKLLQTNLIDKLKARLCACGNELWSASAETYSPTIGALAYATVHQLAIIDNMKMCTVDTVGAYLYQEYPDSEPPLYLVLPANVAAICNLDPTDHYRIRKYLYGLPDSGRAYYKAYSTHLALHGYRRTTSDPCLFVKITGDVRTYVFTHVDDTFVCSTSSAEHIRLLLIMT
jgi:Reverse transcriptase (RNA-dependent DNA polymerase)